MSRPSPSRGFFLCARPRAASTTARAPPAPSPRLPRRNDKYPRALRVDFRKLRTGSLRRYLDAFELPPRPDAGDWALLVMRP